MSVPQLPLALRAPPDQRFESFVGAPDGALAQLRLLATSGGHEPVYLAGPQGTGKTHLCLAVCAAAEEAGRSVAYVPLAAAAGRARDALDSLDQRALVALDGLESVAGHREDELAVFDFHNRARAAGQSLLYAARVPPDLLPMTLPDLRSRLSQCARIMLESLHDDGRRMLLRDRAQRRGLVLEEPALDWVLAHVDRQPSALVALLERLDRESLAAQRRITVPFLRDVVGSRD